MDQANDFECRRCAACCRSLLERREGILRGLPLTDKETKLFPAKTIAPKLAIGVERPETLILYQLIANSCPHVNEKNECRVYTSRPLMCQSFPIVAGAISNRCQVFNYRRPGVAYDEPYNMTAQLKASERLEEHIRSRLSRNGKKGLRIWEYDPNSKKWLDKGLYEE
jgi:Fe-S-cluster containining protein